MLCEQPQSIVGQAIFPGHYNPTTHDSEGKSANRRGGFISLITSKFFEQIVLRSTERIRTIETDSIGSDIRIMTQEYNKTNNSDLLGNCLCEKSICQQSSDSFIYPPQFSSLNPNGIESNYNAQVVMGAHRCRCSQFSSP